VILAIALASALLFSPADVAQKPWLGKVDTAGWSLIGMTLKKDRVNLYRPLSGQEDGRLRYAWLRQEYEDPARGTVKTLYVFDCRGRTELTLDTFTYPGPNMSGAETDESSRLESSPISMKHLSANSPIARAFNLACAP
jgi:hypothetical protein